MKRFSEDRLDTIAEACMKSGFTWLYDEERELILKNQEIIEQLKKIDFQTIYNSITALCDSG